MGSYFLDIRFMKKRIKIKVIKPKGGSFMKKIFLCLLSVFIYTNTFADTTHKLLPKYFGHVKYDGVKRQMGLLVNPIEGEREAYYAIVLEYLSPFREENFIPEFVRPGKKKLLSKKQNSYLQELLQWVQIYKIVESDKNTYQLFALSVKDGKFIVSDSPVEGKIKINKKDAVVTVKVGERLLTGDLDSQKRFPLKSSWDLKYVPGPYNPGYKQSDVVILDLQRDMDALTKEATAVFDVTKLKEKEIKIKGEFKIQEAYRGMFIFYPKSGEKVEGAALVTDKIGAFIDVYDAKPVMKTDELILIDPADPYGSQMYFESYGNKDEDKKLK